MNDSLWERANKCTEKSSEVFAKNQTINFHVNTLTIKGESKCYGILIMYLPTALQAGDKISTQP